MFGDSNRPISYEDLHKLKYTEMFIKETLRMFPIAWIYFRDLQTDLLIDDVMCPMGSTFIVSPLVTHTDPELWPNPQKFDPERFTPELCAERHPYSFIPFGGGPRNCPGKFTKLSLSKSDFFKLFMF